MRNYELLLERIASWLAPQGKLFVHIFSHSRYAYPFETEAATDWMGRNFFTGGLMPSHDLLLSFQRHLELEARWRQDGTHYERTSNAWLERTDAQREAVERVMVETYGPHEAKLWLQRWRIFFMACAELFGFKQGSEYGVSHYLFGKTL